MYRRPRIRDRSGELDLDSLMDILSCLVGVMLFLVIYTVLELGSAAYQAEVPIVREAPVNASPVVIMADRGTVRAVDLREPMERLLNGIEIVRPIDVPVFVEQANRQQIGDPFFQYALTYDAGYLESLDPMTTLALEIRARQGAVGDSLHHLTRNSRFAALLRTLDPEEHWIHFEVSESGVNPFRRARDMAINAGFTVMWSPKQIEFPFMHTLVRDDEIDLLRSKRVLSKPEG